MQTKKEYWNYLIETAEFQIISLEKQRLEILRSKDYRKQYSKNMILKIDRNIALMQLILNIKTKNDALLYIRYENELVRYKAEKILKGK